MVVRDAPFPLEVPVTAPPERTPPSLGRYRAQKAEELLGSLVGVISARVVTDDEGAIEEIHVLSTSDLSPKRAVRNVESALLAHMDLAVDHRRISVAQAEPGQEAEIMATLQQARAGRDVIEAPPPVESHAEAAPPQGQVAALGRLPSSVRRSGRPAQAPSPEDNSDRFLFVGHQVTSQRAHRVETRVTLEWRGRRYEGAAWTPDLPKARLEAMAEATLRAIEQTLNGDGEDAGSGAALSLEGVRLVEAFDRRYVLVAVHAVEGRRVFPLAGAVLAGENPEAAAVLATLQATNRRIPGMLEEVAPRAAPTEEEPDTGFGDPFDIWG